MYFFIFNFCEKIVKYRVPLIWVNSPYLKNKTQPPPKSQENQPPPKSQEALEQDILHKSYSNAGT